MINNGEISRKIVHRRYSHYRDACLSGNRCLLRNYDFPFVIRLSNCSTAHHSIYYRGFTAKAINRKRDRIFRWITKKKRPARYQECSSSRQRMFISSYLSGGECLWGLFRRLPKLPELLEQLKQFALTNEAMECFIYLILNQLICQCICIG